MVEGLQLFHSNNLATVIESGQLHVFHNDTYHVGRVFQVGTRVAPEMCKVTGLEVTTEEEFITLEHFGLSMDRGSGIVKVTVAS